MSNADHLRLVEPGDDAARPPSEAPPDPLIGRTIDGRYKVEGVLGEGGMGLVYRARHIVLNKPLAIKVLRPDVSKDDEIITRFRQEAQSASGLRNPHIIDISDFGVLPDGSTYFVMEFLDGTDLTTAIGAENPMEPRRAIGILKQLCDALGAAHDAGIVHRDLKPDNIYLVERGGRRDFVKVLDFGIAKVGSGTKRLTKAGQVFGTPHYMSPEQCAGKNVNHRTDIYAMGVILYEMCCGKVPFDADNLMGVLTKHMYEQPIPPHELPPPVDVPAALEAVILKALAKSEEARYQSTAEMLADLDLAERGGTPGAVVEAVDRESRTGLAARQTLDAGPGVLSVTMGIPPGGARARRWPLLLGGAGLLGVIGVVGVTLALGGEPEAPPEIRPAAEAPLRAEPDPPVDPPPPPPVQNDENVRQTGSTATASVTLRSDPAGVEVLRDDALLGNTPFQIPRPVGDEVVEVVLRKVGYQEQIVRISGLTAEAVTITLERSRRTGRRRTGASETSGATAMTATVAAEPTMAPDMQTMQTMRTGIQTEVLDPWNQ